MDTFLLDIGVNGSTVAIIVAAVLFFERIGKLIPDDAVGLLGAVRKVSKILGTYISNKKTGSR